MSRTPIIVDKEILLAAITDVEVNGPLENLDQLYKAAASLYNEIADNPISFSVVKARIEEWQVVIKTVKGKKGRKSLTIEEKAGVNLESQEITGEPVTLVQEPVYYGNIRTETVADMVSIDKIQNACQPMNTDVQEGCITLDRVVVVGDTDFQLLQRNDCVSKIILDKNNKRIDIWGVKRQGSPDKRIMVELV